MRCRAFVAFDHTMWNRTAGGSFVSAYLHHKELLRTHIFEAKELVTPIRSHRPGGIFKVFLQWRRLWRVRVFLCRRGGGGLPGRRLEALSSVATSHGGDVIGG